jgi:hypothetical protein
MVKKLKKTLSAISIFFFGNTLGFWMNTKYLIYTLYCRFLYFLKKDKKNFINFNEELVSKLKSEGVIIIGKDPNINIIKKKFNHYFENKYNYVDNYKGYQFLRRNLVNDFSSEIFNLLKNNLDIFFKNYYRSYYSIYWANVIRSYPVLNYNDDESLLYHFDDNPTGILKTFIYVNPHDENNGAFRTLLKKESNLLKKKGFLSYTAEDRLENQQMITQSNFNDKIVIFSADEGSILVFENNIIHKGNLPKKDYRDLIILETIPSCKDLTIEDLSTSLLRPIVSDYPFNPFYYK